MTDEVEELTVKFSDTINQPVIRERVEDIVQEDLQYREAFRDYPGASDINSNTIEIPVPDDDMGLASQIDEGGEFPREEESYSKETLTFDKYGFEVTLTHEAIEDSMLNIVQDQVDRQARQLQETLNGEAFDVLQGNTQSSNAGDADGTFTYSDVIDARKQLVQQNYEPDLLIADVDAASDLLSDSNFLNASDMQGEMRRSGQIGRIAGLDVVEARDDHNITGNTNPGAFLVDTDYYGYEGTREGITTEEYEETRTMSEVYRVYTRIGWVVVQPDAAVTVEG